MHGNINLLVPLEILYQIIFHSGLVPDSFCTDVLTPVLKQGNDPSVYGSYCPITVSSVLRKLMELLVINDIKVCYYSPDSRFKFKKSVSRDHISTLGYKLSSNEYQLITIQGFAITGQR